MIPSVPKGSLSVIKFSGDCDLVFRITFAELRVNYISLVYMLMESQMVSNDLKKKKNLETSTRGQVSLDFFQKLKCLKSKVNTFKCNVTNFNYVCICLSNILGCITVKVIKN